MSQTGVHGPMNVIGTKLLGLRGLFGNDLGKSDTTGDAGATTFEDNWSFDWWKLFMKLGPLHPKASWGVTRGQVTKTAPLVKNFREVCIVVVTGFLRPPTHARTQRVCERERENNIAACGTCLSHVNFQRIRLFFPLEIFFPS